MTRWALFLRAVNVTGTGTLKMEALRAALSEAGFSDVRTLLASGNAIVSSDRPRAEVQAEAERITTALVGKPTPVILRGAAELDAHLAALAPYEADPTWRSTGVALLDGLPTAEGLARLAAFDARGDLAVPAGSAIILAYQQGAGTTALTNDRLERLLGLRATGRNGNTLRKARAALG